MSKSHIYTNTHSHTCHESVYIFRVFFYCASLSIYLPRYSQDSFVLHVKLSVRRVDLLYMLHRDIYIIYIKTSNTFARAARRWNILLYFFSFLFYNFITLYKKKRENVICVLLTRSYSVLDMRALRQPSICRLSFWNISVTSTARIPITILLDIRLHWRREGTREREREKRFATYYRRECSLYNRAHVRHSRKCFESWLFL